MLTYSIARLNRYAAYRHYDITTLRRYDALRRTYDALRHYDITTRVVESSDASLVLPVSQGGFWCMFAPAPRRTRAQETFWCIFATAPRRAPAPAKVLVDLLYGPRAPPRPLSLVPWFVL